MSYKKLQVWQKSMCLARHAYVLTNKFPKDELYCLTSQIRRAAISIPSNIAEGSQRGSDKEFARFLLIARGSLVELETQLLLAESFGYCESGELRKVFSLIEEISRMLYSFRSQLSVQSS
ncbi:MAG: four helix bundle protein [Candidatus Peribacteraceae bacterium]|nr:four helix bundle protein [Candidatus Peribacteraceae bacterium]